MSTTANLGLEILTEGQANKEASITESHQQLDALVQAAIIDRDLATPPGSPSEGDVHLVAASATGDWSGHDGKFAHRRNGAWAFITPKEGWRIWVKDEDKFLVYDGTNWTEISASGGGGGGLLAGFHGLWEQIDRQEFSGQSTITVGGGQDPADYDAYLLLVPAITPSADGAAMSILASTDGGSSTISDYVRHGRVWKSVDTDTDFGSESTTGILSGAIDTADTGKGWWAALQVFGPAENSHKALIMHQGWPDNLGASLLQSQVEHGWIEDTGEIDSFVIAPSTGTISGTIVLLGLKKSETAGRVVIDSTTARTLTNNDNNRIIDFTNAGTGVTVTIPDSLAQGFACSIVNRTGGSMTISAGGTLTVIGDTSLNQNSGAEIWMLSGNIALVSAI